ncbi:MAG: hypothetical protein MI784_00275 [Cytophagales bacterium]|nr:hypothetical protein [Cytophagales bacterium]
MSIFLFSSSTVSVRFYPNLNHFINGLRKEYSVLPQERKDLLKQIGLFIKQKKKEGKPVSLVFHEKGNHQLTPLSEVWANAAKAYYRVPGVEVYSMGKSSESEVKRDAIRSLEKSGYIAYRDSVGSRRLFRVYYAFGERPVRVYTKSKLRRSVLESDDAIHIFLDDSQSDFVFSNALHYPIPDQAFGDIEAVNRQIGLEMMFLFAHFRE